MSSVNYNLNNKGVRLINPEKAWIVGKNKKPRLNPKFHFVGKVNMSMNNMVLTVSDKNKPKYKGDIYDLNRTAKSQIVDYFFNEKGKRNKKSIAYLVIEKK